MPVPLPSLKWLVFNIFKKSILVSTITKRTINILISFVYDNVQLFAATWIIVLASDLHQGERFFENIGENFYYFLFFFVFWPLCFTFCFARCTIHRYQRLSQRFSTTIYFHSSVITSKQRNFNKDVNKNPN